MHGNVDLVFLEFVRCFPNYGQYWFIEYDVFWRGHWGVFFEHFERSRSDLIATTLQAIDEVPHKENMFTTPKRVPETVPLDRTKMVKGFLPLCRLSRAALTALDDAYRSGVAGHYELMLPTILVHAGLRLEDIGGNGRFVRPENRNRFYFSTGSTYSHSPGTFVFRPVQRVLPRNNTLWHPVKPPGVPNWHPLGPTGGPGRQAVQAAKRLVGRVLVRLWFAFVWRPL